MVVLYQNTLEESITIRSLIDCCRQQSDIAERLSILIYDNSPSLEQPTPIDLLFGAMEYRRDVQNGGLVAAYKYALTIAQRKNIDWLLLLDQDTVVEVGLLSALFQQICSPSLANVCAIVPKLVRDSIMLSPQVVGKFRNHSISPKFSGLSPKLLTALNSGSCIRVQALINAGGFPREYWLDYLDHIIFHRLQAAGGRIFVLDTAIQHQLSSRNLETEMSVERYKNMLAAEWMFVQDTGWGGGVLVHRVRLLKRALTYSFKMRDKNYALQALHAAFS